MNIIKAVLTISWVVILGLSVRSESFEADDCEYVLFIDRLDYILGDTLRFSLYLEGSPKVEHIVNMDLFGVDGQFIKRKKIRAKNQMVHGYFCLNTLMETGVNSLVAQIETPNNSKILARKNFFFFDPRLDVHEILSSKGIGFIKTDEWLINYKLESWIEGLPSKLYFQILDKNENPINSSGIVLNQNNDTVLNFDNTA